MNQPPFNQLSDWLAWQETLHPSEIELGLDRIRDVASRLGVLGTDAYVITIGGTNGKGSSVAMFAEAYRAAGYRVAEYTSPHLLRYNERIRIDGREVGDEALCQAFAAVEKARQGVSLTYFEYGTLAALCWFKIQKAQILILEVGLGGRLDAVNILDADMALITNIGLDHMDWLGNSRAEIAAEKAGIARPGIPVIYNDPDPVPELLATLEEMGSHLQVLGSHYWLEGADDDWMWCHEDGTRVTMPSLGHTPLQRMNGAAVIAGLHRSGYRPDIEKVTGLLGRNIPAGRQQWSSCESSGAEIEVLTDVAHNIEAATQLHQCLLNRPAKGRSFAVFSALADKPIESMTELMDSVIDEWHVSGLSTDRGLSGKELQARMRVRGDCCVHESIESAWSHALSGAKAGDRVVVFGSFYTVEAVLKVQESRKECT